MTTRVDAPKQLRLFCRRCNRVHLFSLVPEQAIYFGRCVEIAIPESLLEDINRQLGHRVTVLTLLAQYSSVIEYGVEELTMPEHCLVRVDTPVVLPDSPPVIRRHGVW